MSARMLPFNLWMCLAPRVHCWPWCVEMWIIRHAVNAKSGLYFSTTRNSCDWSHYDRPLAVLVFQINLYDLKWVHVSMFMYFSKITTTTITTTTTTSTTNTTCYWCLTVVPYARNHQAKYVCRTTKNKVNTEWDSNQFQSWKTQKTLGQRHAASQRTKQMYRHAGMLLLSRLTASDWPSKERPRLTEGCRLAKNMSGWEQEIVTCSLTQE